MDGSSEERTLNHIGIWSLNLYFGRNFSNRFMFEAYEQAGGRLPLLVTEYGVDAMDTNAWYTGCFSNASEHAPCASDRGFERFVDEGMQVVKQLYGKMEACSMYVAVDHL